jgi:hypothetical protein
VSPPPAPAQWLIGVAAALAPAQWLIGVAAALAPAQWLVGVAAAVFRLGSRPRRHSRL